MHGLLFVGWRGKKPFTPEQLCVLRNVACEMLKRGGRLSEKKKFDHTSCDGVLEHKRRGSFGSLSGHYFFADLGDDTTLNFFIPHGTHKIALPENVRIVTYVPSPPRNKTASGDTIH